MLSRFAAELELAEPLVPWHADRAPVAALASALDAAAATAAKIGLDVVLLAQTEVSMTDDLYSEQRTFGVDGDYLGATATFVDRVLTAYGSRP